MWLPFWRFATNPALRSAFTSSWLEISVGNFTGAAGGEFQVFSSRFSRDRVAVCNAVFELEIRRFADIPPDLIMRVTLGHTSGQCRHRGDVSAVRFPLNDDCIAHRKMTFDPHDSSDSACDS